VNSCTGEITKKKISNKGEYYSNRLKISKLEGTSSVVKAKNIYPVPPQKLHNSESFGHGFGLRSHSFDRLTNNRRFFRSIA
jgi:hypothetical protein